MRVMQVLVLFSVLFSVLYILSHFTVCSYIYTHSSVCVCISCTGWSFIIDVCVYVKIIHHIDTNPPDLIGRLPIKGQF